jgi:arylesterase / paraoxonase
MAWPFYLAVATFVALLSVYVPSTTTNIAGRAYIDPVTLTRWTGSPPLSNSKCVVDRIANACEDVAIHFQSSTAFLACGDPVERRNWYPAWSAQDSAARSEASFRESLFSYDIVKKKTTELKIEGLDGDFVTHGLDIFHDPSKKSTVGWAKP